MTKDNHQNIFSRYVENMCCKFHLVCIYFIVSSSAHADNLDCLGCISLDEKFFQEPLNRTDQNVNNIENVNGPLFQDDETAFVKDIFKDGFSVAIHHKCPRRGENLKLIVTVLSKPPNYSARMSIRETWGQFGRRPDMRIIFLMGAQTDSRIENQLTEEMKMQEDIVQGNFLDSHSNTNFKIISALEWVIKYCTKAKFVLKVHDDVFVNVPHLLTFIKTHTNHRNTIFARLQKNSFHATIKRNLGLNIFTPNESSSTTHFPTVLGDDMYLLTNDTIHDLFYEALQKKMIDLQYAFFVHVMGNNLGIKYINVDNFTCQDKKTVPCNLHSCYSLSNVEPKHQYEIRDRLSKCDMNCSLHGCYKSLATFISPNRIILFSIVIHFLHTFSRKINHSNPFR